MSCWSSAFVCLCAAPCAGSWRGSPLCQQLGTRLAPAARQEDGDGAESPNPKGFYPQQQETHPWQ